MHKPEVFITLDQFKVLAARITAKNDFIIDFIERQKKMFSELAQPDVLLVLDDVLKFLRQPSDSFFASCKQDMQAPLVHQPTQVELFGEEFC